MSDPRPRRVEFEGPNRWSVWMDEDGCHVRTQGGDGLEECDVRLLFDLWQTVKAMKAADQIPAPKTPDLPF